MLPVQKLESLRYRYAELEELLCQPHILSDAKRYTELNRERAELTELVRDVPLDTRVSDLARVSWERDDVHKLFDNLQFRVLRDRLFATLTAPQPEAEDGFEIDITRLETGAVADAVVDTLAPIRERYLQLTAQPDYVRGVLRTGAERAREEAGAKVRRAQSAIGLLPA